MFTVRWDMRSPTLETAGAIRARQASTTELYTAACDMSAWAETRGCIAAVLCEHHCADDGYLPSPLLLASAIAARTTTLMLNLTVILPFYDPARLAEDIAVLDHLSAGRASYIFGIGYRPEEYEHFGLTLSDRGRLADEKLDVLRRLLRGEVVDHAGRRMVATPRPRTPGGPMLTWGGASLAAARRAGRNGLGLLANGVVPGMREAYENACRDNGHEPGMVVLPDRNTLTNCFVANDIDAAWNEIGRYLLHDARSYSEWNTDNLVSANVTTARTVDELRATSRTHVVMSTDEAARRMAAGEVLNASPLCGGIPPDLAWPYLERLGNLSS